MTARPTPGLKRAPASDAPDAVAEATPLPETPREPARVPAATAAPLRRLVEIGSTFLAVIGFRVERLNAVWVAGGVASIGLAHFLIGRGDWRLTVPYFFATLVAYYGGNTAILASRGPTRLVARLGEAAAFRRYETILGLMFLNQGLGVGCMTALPLGRVPIAPWIAVSVGIGLFVAGAVVKLWATLVVGVDVYYYRDMFLGRRIGPRAVSGPYRLLRNPMYGVGQLQGYGWALVAGSLPGLLAAAAGHLLIFAFYLAVERPFVRRVYPPSPAPAA